MHGSRTPATEYARIVARRQAGESVADLAERYACSGPTIYNILRRAGTSVALPNGGPGQTPEMMHVSQQIAASLLAYADRLGRAADELRQTASKLRL